MENKYTINEVEYKLNVLKDEEGFWEASLVSEDGNKILQRYGDTVKEAKKDLQDAIEELEFKPGVNNRYVLWGDLSEEEKITKAFSKLYNDGNTKLYQDANTVESDFNTESFGYSEFNECDAQECKYNNDCYCTADRISVGTSDACTCSETECKTFICH